MYFDTVLSLLCEYCSLLRRAVLQEMPQGIAQCHAMLLLDFGHNSLHFVITDLICQFCESVAGLPSFEGVVAIGQPEFETTDLMLDTSFCSKADNNLELGRGWA